MNDAENDSEMQNLLMNLGVAIARQAGGAFDRGDGFTIIEAARHLAQYVAAKRGLTYVERDDEGAGT